MRLSPTLTSLWSVSMTFLRERAAPMFLRFALAGVQVLLTTLRRMQQHLAGISPDRLVIYLMLTALFALGLLIILMI